MKKLRSQAPRRPAASQGQSPAAEPDPVGLERLIFFSDAVFAIAITLLTLDIRLPASGGAPSNEELLAQLLGIWHKYLAYGISFLAIGSFWMGHHRRFRYIKRYDRGLLTLNLLFLMVIAFVPFPTSVVSESGNRTATIFYALTMTLAGVLLAAVWWYAAWRDRLVDPDLNAQQRRRELDALLLTAALFSASIGLAFLNPGLARLWWLLALAIPRFVQKG
jgi:uncharacterized membrane protein